MSEKYVPTAEEANSNTWTYCFNPLPVMPSYSFADMERSVADVKKESDEPHQ